MRMRRFPLRVNKDTSRAIDRHLELMVLNNTLRRRCRFLEINTSIDPNILWINDFFIMNKHKIRFFYEQHHTEDRTTKIMERPLKTGVRNHR